MAKRLFVGNLPYSVTSDRLKDFFASAGAVSSANVVIDRETGKSRGFGFVEFSDDAAGDAAVSSFNGKEIDGRAITVNEARPPQSGGGGGGRGDRGGYRGGR